MSAIANAMCRERDAIASLLVFYYAMSEAITAVRACQADKMDLEKYLEEDSENV